MSRKDKILLVEGYDDREVIYQFCNHHDIDNRELFSVEPKNGVERLIDDLRLRVRTEVTTVLAAVIDADADLNARWEQIRTAVAGSGYILPNAPIKGGTIIDAPKLNRPKLGIWLMPDNQVSGMLEDFLLRLANEQDSLIHRSENVVDSIPETERLFGDTKRSKAIIHTWLAWQEEPGTSLGLSIRYWFRLMGVDYPLLDND